MDVGESIGVCLRPSTQASIMSAHSFGIVGAFLASFLLPRIGLFTTGDIVGQIIAATIGAVVLLVLIGVLRRA
jgi:uncharacterized membrane protein YeaQ/YmgE (transglycosylase-associated protein family)